MANSFYQWLAGALLALLHPFYVSMTEIEHNKNNNSLEVSVRIFSDDLERILEKNYKVELDLTHPQDQKAVNTIVSDYILEHFSVKADSKTAALSFSGYEMQEGSAWCYFEAKGIPPPKKIEVTNSLLHDYINQQVNMVQVKANGKSETKKLDFPATLAVFNF